MAGTLTISTLSDGTNSTSSTNCIQGSAKAWVNFNGTTSPGTIRASYNVGSVTKNGTGDYTINFTNALPDANYSVTGMSRFGGGADTFGMSVVSIISNIASPLTSSSVRVRTFFASGSSGLNDSDYVCVSCFR